MQCYTLSAAMVASSNPGKIVSAFSEAPLGGLTAKEEQGLKTANSGGELRDEKIAH